MALHTSLASLNCLKGTMQPRGRDTCEGAKERQVLSTKKRTHPLRKSLASNDAQSQRNYCKRKSSREWGPMSWDYFFLLQNVFRSQHPLALYILTL